jgi:predicted Zn-dependent protease
VNRRELLSGLGVASASTLLWAFGCGRPPDAIHTTTPVDDVREVRAWLRDAIALLASAYPSVHALAIARRRTTAAVDVLGTGVSRARRDGVVLTVRDREGMWREQVSSDLSKAGVIAAVKALIGDATKRASLDFGPAPATPPTPPHFGDLELRNRVDAITRMDKPDSRVVYASALIDVDDSTVWSISPGHDREQRLVRIRERVLRAAWNGTRPVVSEAEHAWIGGLEDQVIDASTVAATTRRAVELMTPSNFDDGERTVVLEPSVTATLVDAGTRALLTSAAGKRPEVRRGLTAGASVAAPIITLVDDPTVRGAYGGFQFDDEGEAAAPITLIAAGKLSGVLSDRAGGGRGRGRRPGHVGPVEPSPSHLRLARGSGLHDALFDDGFILEGGHLAIVDPSTTRVVIGAARAREIRGGKATGRVFPDVELVGDLAVLLAAVSGVSADTSVVAYRDEREGEPRWRSIDAPWLRTKGYVRARRRLA